MTWCEGFLGLCGRGVEPDWGMLRAMIGEEKQKALRYEWDNFIASRLLIDDAEDFAALRRFVHSNPPWFQFLDWMNAGEPLEGPLRSYLDEWESEHRRMAEVADRLASHFADFPK